VYVAAAVIQLILFSFLMIYFMKKQGLIVLVDQAKIMFILWIVTLILYDFRLSTHYYPTIQINLIVILIWGSFLFLTRFVKLEEEDVHHLFKGFKDKVIYRRYFIISNIIIAIAVLVFAWNVYKYGFAIDDENKIGKQAMDHYAGYIVYMLVLAAEIKYILFRNHKSYIDLIGLGVSAVVLFLTLNRGPIAFLFITIGLYEVFNFINIKDRLTRKTQYMTYAIFVLTVALFIAFFGYMGNLRMDYVLENVYNTTLAKHYGVSELMPSGLLWVYIYLTSPLENAAFSLANQGIQYTYFNNLLYPFVKFIANIFGKGEAYKQWFMDRASYSPYLQEKVGLNTSSFITESFSDLDLAGFIVYLAIYLIIAYLAVKLIKKTVKMSSNCKMLVYTNITSILLWSVFVNSFKIPILLMNIMLLLLIEYDYKKGYSKKLMKLAKLNK
jgi:hypothetical protein